MNQMKPLEPQKPVLLRGHSDELMDRYYEISQRTEIPDVHGYGDEWELLAHEFSKQDRPYMAAMCFSRAAFYGIQPLGAYVRKIENSFSALLPATVKE